MTPAQLFVLNLVWVLLVATLAGLAWRRRLSECVPFAALLMLTCTTNRLVAWWPAIFYTRRFWVPKELAFCALYALVVVDLCVSLRAWPRARRVGIAAVSLVALATAIALWATDVSQHKTQLELLIARGNVGAAAAFAALVGVVWWYRLPMSRYHHQIALGAALHLSAYGVLLSLVDWIGWGFRPYLLALDPAVYAATVGVWLLAAWRPVEALEPYLAEPVRS